MRAASEYTDTKRSEVLIKRTTLTVNRPAKLKPQGTQSSTLERHVVHQAYEVRTGLAVNTL